MGYREILVKIFDPVFSPLLDLPPFLVIFIITLVATFIITIIYKLVTDQDLMKRLRQDQKDAQKKLKELKDHPEKLVQHQKEMWAKNMELMKHSFKPTIFTFLPIIILFGWLSFHLAYVPLAPNTNFDVSMMFDEGVNGEVILVGERLNLHSNSTQTVTNGEVRWTLSGDMGRYILEFNYGDFSYDKPIIISEKQEYEEPIKVVNANGVKQIVVHNKELKPLGDFSLFGWKPGWLGTYFVLSIIMSFTIRKLMKVH